MKSTILKTLIFSIVLAINIQNALGQTIHAFLVFDIEDEKIGKSVQDDYEYISKLLDAVQEATDFQLETYSFFPNETIMPDGNTTRNRGVLNTINSATVKPDDLFFYIYSGHGWMAKNPADPFPQMAWSPRFIHLSEVRERIRLKKPKFTFIMADLCNVGFRNSPKRTNFNLDFESPKISQNFIKTLFVNNSGELTICSALRNSSSYGSNFFKSLSISMNKISDGNYQYSWQTLLSETTSLYHSVIERKPYYEANINGRSFRSKHQSVSRGYGIIMLDNQSNHDLEITLTYQSPSGQWFTKGPWLAKKGTKFYPNTIKGKLVTSTESIFFYAKTKNSSIELTGDFSCVYRGTVLSMKKSYMNYDEKANYTLTISSENF